jgi:sigma-B regulation protein RsbU (phosphoserine phosphatase)
MPELALCRDIPPSVIDPLLARCTRMDLAAGQVLLEPGRENHHLYLLLAGQLRVRIGERGQGEGFAIEAGECLGEISLIDGRPTTAWVTADTACSLLAITEHMLWQELMTIPVFARNFMRQLGERFRARNAVMQQVLAQQLRFEQMQQELAIAHDLQLGMLPNSNSLAALHPAIEIAARMIPAKAVGGDFYDAFRLDEQRLCFAIGDVSGKGVPAALFMARTMALLRASLLRNRSLPAAMHHLNQALCTDNAICMFSSLLLLVLDVETCTLQIVNGGHNRPVMLAAERAGCLLPLPRGIVLGIDPNAVFELAKMRFGPGDRLLLYTDGVTEADNPLQTFFGEPRLLHSTLHAPTDCAGLIENVIASVAQFAAGAEQSDDITLLSFRYRVL